MQVVIKIWLKCGGLWALGISSVKAIVIYEIILQFNKILLLNMNEKTLGLEKSWF